MRILVTGGAGYIGSHTIVELVAQGHSVAVVDNLSNSNPESLRRVARIIGQEVPFYQADCTDKKTLGQVFNKVKPDAVIHFAALKSVSESVAQPIRYYQNNINSTLVLCDVMQQKGVKKLIFSSTAAVYGSPDKLPITETTTAGTGIVNPYGRSKYMIERILEDIKVSDSEWQITILRYFNPIGAHQSGLIGEDPNGPPNNLLPYISQVAVGRRPSLNVYGDDYGTADGTGVRDYIHVVDLVRGHVAALEHLHKGDGVKLYNLGTGHGTSVFELVHAFEKACGHSIAYTIVARRSGDIAACYADPAKAEKELGWKAQKTIEDACRDAWRWQSNNPNGFNKV